MMKLTQEVLRAGKRVEERAVGFVDARGQCLGVRLCGLVGVFVRVAEVLEVEEFAAEVGLGDREGGVRGWAVGDCLREDGVVVCYVGGFGV